jgi:hypothetical protein
VHPAEGINHVVPEPVPAPRFSGPTITNTAPQFGHGYSVLSPFVSVFTSLNRCELEQFGHFAINHSSSMRSSPLLSPAWFIASEARIEIELSRRSRFPCKAAVAGRTTASRPKQLLPQPGGFEGLPRVRWDSEVPLLCVP